MNAMIEHAPLAVVPADTGTIIHAIIAAATDHKTDIAKMQAMMAMAKEMQEAQAKAAYATAIARFTGLKTTIATNRTGTAPGDAKYAYADWPQMEAAIRPWLAECELSLTQWIDPPVMAEGKIVMIMVHTRLMHSHGHFEEVSFPAMPNPMVAAKLSPSQAIQQGITYAKRQGAAMILGLSTREDRDDDDAHKVAALSDDQLSTLTDLMAAWEPTDDQRAALLQWCRVAAIEDLPPSKFETVAKKLREKVAGKSA